MLARSPRKQWCSMHAFQIKRPLLFLPSQLFFYFCHRHYSITRFFKTRPENHMGRGLSSARPTRMCFPSVFVRQKHAAGKNPQYSENFVFNTFNCPSVWQLSVCAPAQRPQKEAVLSCNNKPAALWIKSSISVTSIFYAVLINTLTVICIKMADSCSKSASICPVHRGVAGDAEALVGD